MKAQRILHPRDIPNKEMRALAQMAVDAGWVILQRRNGHLAWRSPEGATVFTSYTPSDRRAVGKIRTDLRRNGLTSV